MNFRFITIIFIICASIPAHAQVRDSLFVADSAAPRTAWNNAFIEILGSNIFLSFNYERLFGDDFAIRVGAYPFAGPNQDTTIKEAGLGILATASISRLFGIGSHKFELGVGLGCFVPIRPDNGWGIASAILGYRYQPKQGGLFFRIAATPLIMKDAAIFGTSGFRIIPFGSTQQNGIDGGPVLPWIGISIGGCFERFY